MFSDYVNWIRAAELERVKPLLPAGSRILEFGAGSGWQARELSNLGFDVEAIDLASSNYAETRVFPVRDYDGRVFPFPDSSFDVVFSSNTLEHVRDLAGIHAECKRVLRPGGSCIHILPTGRWQFWTILTGFPAAGRAIAQARSLRQLASGLYRLARAFLPVRHGERGTALLELWLFRPEWWRRNFRKHGFEIVEDWEMGLFYSGYGHHGYDWSIEKRKRLARRLGSSCHLFRLVPASDTTEP